MERFDCNVEKNLPGSISREIFLYRIIFININHNYEVYNELLHWITIYGTVLDAIIHEKNCVAFRVA